MSEKDAFISIKVLSKHFGSVKAVDEIDMAIGSGDKFGLSDACDADGAAVLAPDEPGSLSGATAGRSDGVAWQR